MQRADMAMMTESERFTVRRFAAGEKSLRDEEEQIFNNCCADQGRELEILFLSEVFTPAPDLLLRAEYRQKLALTAA